MIVRPIVVFPEPLSPTIASVSPRLIESVTSSTAFRGMDFRKRPPPITNHFFSPSVWMTFARSASSA